MPVTGYGQGRLGREPSRTSGCDPDGPSGPIRKIDIAVGWEASACHSSTLLSTVVAAILSTPPSSTSRYAVTSCTIRPSSKV